MGGPGEFFGFDGNINRLGYLWRALVVGVALAALTMLGRIALATFRPDGMGDFEAWTQRLGMAIILIGLWAGCALTTRRLRDMGLEPAHVVPAYAALWVINTELLQPMTQIQPEVYGPIEATWLVLQVLVGLVVLAWPSRAPRRAPLPAYAGAQPTAYLDWRQGG